MPVPPPARVRPSPYSKASRPRSLRVHARPLLPSTHRSLAVPLLPCCCEEAAGVDTCIPSHRPADPGFCFLVVDLRGMPTHSCNVMRSISNCHCFCLSYRVCSTFWTTYALRRAPPGIMWCRDFWILELLFVGFQKKVCWQCRTTTSRWWVREGWERASQATSSCRARASRFLTAPTLTGVLQDCGRARCGQRGSRHVRERGGWPLPDLHAGRQKGYEIMRADMRSLEQRGLILPADKVGPALLCGCLCAPLSLRCDAPRAPRLLCVDACSRRNRAGRGAGAHYPRPEPRPVRAGERRRGSHFREPRRQACPVCRSLGV